MVSPEGAPLGTIRVIDNQAAHRPLTLSIGVARLAGEHDTNELIRRADRALYDAKAAERTRSQS